jgi:hypothetical protein
MRFAIDNQQGGGVACDLEVLALEFVDKILVCKMKKITLFRGTSSFKPTW